MRLISREEYTPEQWQRHVWEKNLAVAADRFLKRNKRNKRARLQAHARNKAKPKATKSKAGVNAIREGSQYPRRLDEQPERNPGRHPTNLKPSGLSLPAVGSNAALECEPRSAPLGVRSNAECGSPVVAASIVAQLPR